MSKSYSEGSIFRDESICRAEELENTPSGSSAVRRANFGRQLLKLGDPQSGTIGREIKEQAPQMPGLPSQPLIAACMT